MRAPRDDEAVRKALIAYLEANPMARAKIELEKIRPGNTAPPKR